MGTQPPGQSRRAVLRALGAGTALSTLGVTVVGAQEDDDGGDDDGRTVHRVRTLAGPSTNPDRPADFHFQPTALHVAPGDVLAFEFVTPDHNVVAYHPAFGMQRRVPVGVEAFSSPLKGWRPSSIPGDQVEPPSLPGGGSDDGPGDDDVDDDSDDDNDDGDGDDDTDTGGDDADGGTAGQAASTDGPVPDQFLLSPTTPGVYDLLCSPHEHFGMAMRVVVGDETDAPFETESAEELPPPRAGPVEIAREVLTDPALAPENVVEAGTVAWADLDVNEAPGGGEG